MANHRHCSEIIRPTESFQPTITRFSAMMHTTNTSRRRRRWREKGKMNKMLSRRKKDIIREAVRAHHLEAGRPSRFDLGDARPSLVTNITAATVAQAACTPLADITAVCLHRGGLDRENDRVHLGVSFHYLHRSPATMRNCHHPRVVWLTSRHPGGTPGFSSMSKGCNRLTSRRG